MGLDMYMYGIVDISSDDIPDGEKTNVYEDKGYSLIDKKDYDEDEFDGMFHDLIPYAVIRNVSYTLTDWEKIKKSYNLPENSNLCGISSDGTYWFIDSDSKKDYKIFISEQEMRKYDYQELRESLVFKCEELAYWRKEYDLQDLIHNEYKGTIYNCGFHLMDDNLMKDINKYLKKRDMDRQSINNPEYIAKMYHEWY